MPENLLGVEELESLALLALLALLDCVSVAEIEFVADWVGDCLLVVEVEMKVEVEELAVGACVDLVVEVCVDFELLEVTSCAVLLVEG